VGEQYFVFFYTLTTLLKKGRLHRFTASLA